jgi:hypothetical protein
MDIKKHNALTLEEFDSDSTDVLILITQTGLGG